jgi:hypothetical protein
VIDERWNNIFHCLIHAAGLYLNPTYSYACGFRFDVDVMVGFFQCVQRMVLTPIECFKISKQMEIYTLGVGTFGYYMIVHAMNTRMSCKIQVKFVSKFQISTSFISIFVFSEKK